MAKRDAITAEFVRKVLDYNPDTGVLTWKARTPDMFRESDPADPERRCRLWNGKHAGKVARCLGAGGYIDVRILGRTYRAHRLIWLIVYGVWPDDQIDHANGYRADNRLENIREATQKENGQNIIRQNTSGHTGVYWDLQTLRWRAQIMVDGKQISLGRFDDIEGAASAYLTAKASLHTFQPVPRTLSPPVSALKE